MNEREGIEWKTARTERERERGRGKLKRREGSIFLHVRPTFLSTTFQKIQDSLDITGKIFPVIFRFSRKIPPDGFFKIYREILRKKSCEIPE